MTSSQMTDFRYRGDVELSAPAGSRPSAGSSWADGVRNLQLIADVVRRVNDATARSAEAEPPAALLVASPGFAARGRPGRGPHRHGCLGVAHVRIRT